MADRTKSQPTTDAATTGHPAEGWPELLAVADPIPCGHNKAARFIFLVASKKRDWNKAPPKWWLKEALHGPSRLPTANFKLPRPGTAAHRRLQDLWSNLRHKALPFLSLVETRTCCAVVQHCPRAMSGGLTPEEKQAIAQAISELPDDVPEDDDPPTDP